MQSRLDRYTGWERRIARVRYSPRGLAAACRISLRQLERYFRAAFGCSLLVWIVKVRMEKAARLLTDGITPKQVASRLCFHDFPHFAKQFKQYYGLTPKQFAHNFLIFKTEKESANTSDLPLFAWSPSLKNEPPSDSLRCRSST